MRNPEHNEEDNVEKSLKNSSNNSNDVVKSFKIISVNPVEDVEATIGSKSKEIIDIDHVNDTSVVDNVELRNDGNTLEVDGEGPENLHDTQLVIDQGSQSKSWDDQKINIEAVSFGIIC